MHPKTSSLALAVCLGLGAASAQAATIVDSLNPVGLPGTTLPGPAQEGIRFFNLAFLGPLGQSFTLGSDVSDLAIAAYFSSFTGSADVTARLVGGAGIGGTEVGSRSFSTGPISRFDAILQTLDFSGLGTVAAGEYTIVFSGTGTLGGGPITYVSPSDITGIDVAGTAPFGPDGPFVTTNPSRDFGIRVTAEPVAPVPLPAPALLIAGAFGGLGLLRARRRRAAS